MDSLINMSPIKPFQLMAALLMAWPLASWPGDVDTTFEALKTVSKQYSVRSDRVDAGYMPKVFNQDGFPICSPMTARTLLMQKTCSLEKIDCTSVSDKRIPSVLAMQALAVEHTATGVAQTRTNNPLDIDHGGGDPAYVLRVMADAGVVFSESCFPLNKFADRVKSGSLLDRAMGNRQAILRLKKAFDDNKRNGITASNQLLINILDRDFGLTKSEAEIEDGLLETDFPSFLHLMLLTPCRTAVRITLLAFTEWPPERIPSHLTVETVLAKIREELSLNAAVAIAFCLNEIPVESIDKCGNKHTLVLMGYQKACKVNGDCRQLLHVQNSWGQDWQDANDDGWVDAETLLVHAGVGHSSQMYFFNQ